MAKKVLLVDDNKVQKIASERVLSKAGYVVVCAEDGNEALKVAREQGPDLVLLDMLLPGLSGLDVLRALKRDANTAKIPVIALSGLPQKNSARLQAEGAEDYFEKTKLFEGKEGQIALLALIAKVLGETRPLAAMSASAATS